MSEREIEKEKGKRYWRLVAHYCVLCMVVFGVVFIPTPNPFLDALAISLFGPWAGVPMLPLFICLDLDISSRVVSNIIEQAYIWAPVPLFVGHLIAFRWIARGARSTRIMLWILYGALLLSCLSMIWYDYELSQIP